MWLGLTTSDWLGIGSMVVVIIGFTITISQVVRVRSAVAKHAGRTAGAMLLVAVTRMQTVEQSLCDASLIGKRDLAYRSVLDWRSQAAEARALLAESGRGESEEALVEPLDLSLAMVPAVLVALDAAPSDLPALLKPLLEQIGSAVVAGQALAVAMMVAKEGSG